MYRYNMHIHAMRKTCPGKGNLVPGGMGFSPDKMKFRGGRRPLPLCSLQGCDPPAPTIPGASAGRRAGSLWPEDFWQSLSDVQRNGAKPHGPRLANGCRSCCLSCLKF